MATAVVVDTHSTVWYLEKDPQLSGPAEKAFDDATSKGQTIYVPSICLVELTYLIEKRRLRPESRRTLIDVIDDPDTTFQIIGLDRGIAEALQRVPRHEVPDLPDRIIAATALSLGLPLVTRDRKIRSSVVETIW